MPDPKMDLEKLKAIRDFSETLVDELQERPDLLPCKNSERDGVGDCISRQGRQLLAEMKTSKMCPRCQVRWHAMMAHRGIDELFNLKSKNGASISFA